MRDFFVILVIILGYFVFNIKIASTKKEATTPPPSQKLSTKNRW
jgi:hypothetical protein